MNFYSFTTLSLFLFICPHSIHTGSALCDKNCPANEIYSKCAGPRQPNCWNRNASIPASSCVPGCVCASGFFRDPNTYLCVPENKCPWPPKDAKICPLNEVYSDFNAGCQRNCDNLNLLIKCIRVPGCVCKLGYVRSQISGKCIPSQECNVCPFGYKRNLVTRKCEFFCDECPKNEEFKECGPYCEQECFPNNLACITLCKQGCFCKNGYVRGPNGNCILKNSCPICPANESYSCGNPMCEKKCSTLNKICTIQPIRCENKCYCNQGYVRDDVNGTCIPINKCGRTITTV